MWNKKMSIVLSIIICFVFLAVLTAALFFGCWFVKTWMVTYRDFDVNGEALQNMLTLFKASFYPCSVFAYITLYCLLKLLFNIKKSEVFINANVKFLRIISWCCFAVAAITFVSGIFMFRIYSFR